MPQPTSPRLRRGLLLAALAVVLGSLVFVLPVLLGSLARGTIIDALEERGFVATMQRVRATPTGRLRARDLCVEPVAGGAGPSACVERLHVRARIRGLRASRVQVRSVDVSGGNIDVPLTWLETFVRQRRDAPGSGDSGSGATRGRLFDDLDGLAVRDLSLTLRRPGGPDAGADADGGVAAQAGAESAERLVIEALELAPFESGAVDVVTTIRLSGVQATASQRVPGLELPETVRVSLRRTADGTFSEASVEGDRPVRLARDDAELAVARVRFDAPVALVLEDVVARAGPADEQVRLTAQRLRAEVGEWTLDPRELYLTSLEAVELAATVDLDPSLRPRLLARLRGDRDDVDAGDDATSDDAASDDNDHNDAPGAGAHSDTAEQEPGGTTGGALEPSWREQMLAELARRQWWEVLPRRIQLRDSRLVARGYDDQGRAGPALRLESATLDYAIRVINTQLDVQLQAQVALDETPAGGLRLEATWNYDRGALDATLELDAVHARALEALRGLPVVDLEAGALTGTARLRGRARDGLTTEGSMRLTSGLVTTRMLAEPLELDDLLVTWRVGQQRRQDGSGRSDVTVEQLDLRLRGAALSLTPSVRGLLRGATPPLERVDVRLHVPEQDATLLFEAVPATLRGPLVGTVMRGTYGVTLAFPITWVPTRGGYDVEVGGATDLEILDDRLELVLLPHDVDVRRLNGPMTFTFRGPNDAINRSLRLAPPRWLAGPYPTVEADLAGVTPASWVRLDEMSYYLVATQLYREDGSFFRNHGINWTQMRRVIGDAIRRGELGRGASTITMQTVKNVFLSHERSLERKLQELFLTYWMARTVPRERVLEVYMNVIEWGPSQNGAQEASRFYFGTPVEVLGIRESVWLSMITPSPIRLGNARPRGAVLPGQCQRCDQLIGQLHARGWISRTEMDMGLGNGSVPTALPGGDGSEAGGLVSGPAEGPGAAIAALPIAQRITHQARTGLAPRGPGPAPRTGAAARRTRTEPTP